MPEAPTASTLLAGMLNDVPIANLATRFKINRISRVRGIALLGLMLIVIGVYSRIVITRQYNWIWSPDLVNQVYPWLELQASAWQSGQIPLWDPYLWGGQPLHGQVQPAVAYPLNWLLFSLPQRDGFIRNGFLNWYFVILHMMAAGFAYALARGLGTSRVAGIACGLLFSLGGFMGRTDWPQMSSSALWTPLVLLAIVRAPASTRPFSLAALGGFALGLAFLSGHHQVPIFLSIAAGLFWIAQMLREAVFRPRVILLSAVFFASAGLIAAVQVLPSFEYAKEAVRWVGFEVPAGWKDTVPYQVHDSFASRPHRLLGILIPNIYNHYDHFLGFTGLMLAILGIAATLRRWESRAMLVLALVSLFAAMGGTMAFHGLLYAFVPMVEKARNPAAISALFSVAMAVLAAFGVDALRNRESGGVDRLGARSLAVVGTVLFLFGAFLYHFNAGHFPVDDRFMVSALCALLFAGVLVAWRAERLSVAWLAGSLLFLLVAELSMSALLPFPSRFEKARPGAAALRDRYRDVAEDLREVPHFQRGQVDGEEITIAMGDLYQIGMFEGFTASVPTTVWELGMSQRHVLELYGVSTWVGRGPLYEGQRQLHEFRSGVKAWEVENAFPRTWIAHETVSFESLAAFRAPFDEGKFSGTTVAPFVGPAPQIPQCSAEEAANDESAIVEYSLNRVLIRAHSDCGGLLVLSDNAFPGWRAMLNGKESEILQPYNALRGIVLEPGSHTVEMRYAPRSIVVGGVLTAFGLGLVLVILLWERRTVTNSRSKALAARRHA